MSTTTNAPAPKFLGNRVRSLMISSPDKNWVFSTCQTDEGMRPYVGTTFKGNGAKMDVFFFSNGPASGQASIYRHFFNQKVRGAEVIYNQYHLGYDWTISQGEFTPNNTLKVEGTCDVVNPTNMQRCEVKFEFKRNGRMDANEDVKIGENLDSALRAQLASQIEQIRSDIERGLKEEVMCTVNYLYDILQGQNQNLQPKDVKRMLLDLPYVSREAAAIHSFVQHLGEGTSTWTIGMIDNGEGKTVPGIAKQIIWQNASMEIRISDEPEEEGSHLVKKHLFVTRKFGSDGFPRSDDYAAYSISGWWSKSEGTFKFDDVVGIWPIYVIDHDGMRITDSVRAVASLEWRTGELKQISNPTRSRTPLSHAAPSTADFTKQINAGNHRILFDLGDANGFIRSEVIALMSALEKRMNGADMATVLLSIKKLREKEEQRSKDRPGWTD